MKSKAIRFMAIVLPILMGCVDTSQLYLVPTPSQRWPLGVLTCSNIVPSVMATLRLRVSIANIVPWPTIGNYSCFSGTGNLPPSIMDDEMSGTFMGVDKAAGGPSIFNTYYGQTLRKDTYLYDPSVNNEDPGIYYDPNWVYHRLPNKYFHEKWVFNRPLSTTDEVINGITWRHVVFWQYSSPSSNPNASASAINSQYGTPSDGSATAPLAIAVPQPDALFLLGEVYIHKVDSTHTMVVYAVYKRPVVQDAQWLAARRGLLRKLVDAVKITPLTDAQIEGYKRQVKAYHDAAMKRDCAAGMYTGKWKKQMCK